MFRMPCSASRIIEKLESEIINRKSLICCLQLNASRNIRADLDVTSRMAQCLQQLEARSAYEVWVNASSGNAESCLELGLWSVCRSFCPLLTPNQCLGCTLVAVLPNTDAALDCGVGYQIPQIQTLS